MKLQNKLFIALLITSCSISIHAAEKANEARFDEIAEKGAQIMPFNLDQTVHVFSKKEDGGLQQVVVINQTNTGQIKLILQHLNEIANKFKQGDFSGGISAGAQAVVFEVLDEYGANFVLTEAGGFTDNFLALDGDSWTLVHSDDIAAIYVRTGLLDY